MLEEALRFAEWGSDIPKRFCEGLPKVQARGTPRWVWREEFLSS